MGAGKSDMIPGAMKYQLVLLLCLPVGVFAQTNKATCHSVMPHLASLDLRNVGKDDLSEFREVAVNCVNKRADYMSKQDLVDAFKALLHIDAEIGNRQSDALKIMDESMQALAKECSKRP